MCKLRETTTGQAATKKKKWRYEDEMAFLLPHTKDKLRVSSIEISNEADENEGEKEIQGEDEIGGNIEEQDEQYGNQSNLGTNNGSAEADTVTRKQNTQRKKILPRKKPTESASATLMNYILSQKHAEETRTSVTEKDSIDLFFDSIKATVRTFSPSDFHSLKTNIFNMVTEMESKYLYGTTSNTHGSERQYQQQYQSQQGFNNNSNNYQHSHSSHSSYYNQSHTSPASIERPQSSASSYFENFSPDTPN